MTVDVDRLRRLPLFDELDYKDLSTIAHHVGEVQLEEGQVLFQEGSIPYEMFVIEEGTAEAMVNDEVVGRIGPGEVVGEIALLRFQRRMATVRVTSLAGGHGEREDLQVLEGEMPEIADHLRSVMSARERENAERPDD